MNRHTIIGNLTRDPETGTTDSGANWCRFTVAVNRPFRPKDAPEAEYIRVTAWRGLGDTCAKHLKKGRKVACVGESIAHGWIGQSGDARAEIEMTAQEVEFLDSGKRKDGDEPREPGYAQGNGRAQADPATGFQAVETDELPF